MNFTLYPAQRVPYSMPAYFIFHTMYSILYDPYFMFHITCFIFRILRSEFYISSARVLSSTCYNFRLSGSLLPGIFVRSDVTIPLTQLWINFANVEFVLSIWQFPSPASNFRKWDHPLAAIRFFPLLSDSERFYL